VHGRGAAWNPPNRFERLHVERDGWTDPDDPPPRTELLRDATRSILARNESPDVGFDVGVNPYRGCSHGCVYCLDPATQVLYADMTWRPIGGVQVGHVLVGFDEHARPGGKRRLRASVVERVWWSRRPAHRLVTETSEVITTAEHRWLDGSSRWIRTRSLAPGRTLRALADEEVVQPSTRREYARGFPGGLFDAEDAKGASSRITQADTEVEALFGRPLATTPVPVLAVERGHTRDVVDIQTSTRTFFAAGLATHNCYARPTHEYLGFSAGLDFETKILVKEEAPRLLSEALSSPRWKPETIMLSGNTDAYQPTERRLRLTRRCLEVLADFRNPVGITTKSYLVSRDVDLLGALARDRAAAVVLSITTLRNDIQRVMEPRASTPGRRLAAMRLLAEAGVPVGVNVAPVVPGLTDHELPAILEAAADAGASFAGYILLRLPYGVKDLFTEWLAQHFPDRQEKVLNRVRELRGGKLYDARFEVRGQGQGPWAEQLRALFRVTRERLRLNRRPELSTAAFRAPAPPPRPQLDLFGH
jgi:DNA repair photolyase